MSVVVLGGVGGGGRHGQCRRPGTVNAQCESLR